MPHPAVRYSSVPMQLQVRRAKYDLLVMGVSRRPGQKLFLGETAAAVLKHAPGALLFVAT